MSSDLRAIGRTLIEQRDEIIRRFLASEDGEAMRRIEQAYSALLHEQMPATRDLSSVKPVRPVQTLRPADSTPRARVVSEGTGNITGLAEEAFERHRDRVWTYDSLLEYFESHGIDVDSLAKNPRDALRTAVGNLQKRELVMRVGRGEYQSNLSQLGGSESRRSDVGTSSTELEAHANDGDPTES